MIGFFRVLADEADQHGVAADRKADLAAKAEVVGVVLIDACEAIAAVPVGLTREEGELAGDGAAHASSDQTSQFARAVVADADIDIRNRISEGGAERDHRQGRDR